MDLKDRIKALCSKQNISLNQLEQDLGFGKGYISKLGKSTPNITKIQQIAKRLNVSVDYLMSGDSEQKNIEDGLTARDRRDIAKDLDRIMTEIRNGEDGPLYYNGEELDEASLALLNNAIEYALTQAKKENKVKYNPHKNKK